MTVQMKDMANAIRFLAMDAVEKAKSGHPGMPMGMADVATVLFTRVLKMDASAPRWADRDRFVLSAGHGSMLLYALGYLLGYPDLPIEEIRRFRQKGAKTAGHPEFGHISIADTTTGPLGQGIANAVGMALAERMLAQKFGSEIVDHYTYVMVGDGCLMEGLSQEALSLAGHWKLNRLIVLWDDNQISIDGDTSVTVSDDMHQRFQSAGWDTQSVDGHDPVAIEAALVRARTSDKPSMIACRTVIGFGAPTLAGTEKTHGAPLGEAEIAGARKKLGWSFPPFEIPRPVLEAWRTVGLAYQKERLSWEERLAALSAEKRTAFEDAMAGRLPEGWDRSLHDWKAAVLVEKPSMATRKASQSVLECVIPSVSQLVGGSADLTHSTLTLVKGMTPVQAPAYDGNYLYYGVREHGMAAVMNGLAVHGGFIPYGGTFLVFSDYMRGAMRVSALMKQRVIYILTHDSIGLGEDGPTHQPVETLASFRAMPNILTFRPADPIETAECWQIALETAEAPSLLALSRQSLPTLRTDIAENKSAKGGYVLMEAEGGARRGTIIATGSEVSLAVKARKALMAEGLPVAVVSMPCMALFDAQSEDYKVAVLGGAGVVRVAVEALSTFGWERYTGLEGVVIGMHSFGASAPADELYQHFGITPEAIVDAIKARL